jgi:glutamine synthetase type III
MTERIEQLLSAIDELAPAIEETEAHHRAVRSHAFVFRHDVVPAVARLCESCDSLEAMLDDALGPLPEYRELQFPQELAERIAPISCPVLPGSGWRALRDRRDRDARC